jgi:hypothetical protein
VADSRGEPVAGAEVALDGATATTDAEGRAQLVREGPAPPSSW